MFFWGHYYNQILAVGNLIIFLILPLQINLLIPPEIFSTFNVVVIFLLF